MKNKIIKKSLFILLVSVLTLPLISSKIFADSGIHLPTLEPFNWPIVSLHGPRLVLNSDGSVCTGCSKFHAGIDFSPLPDNADLGYMIKSRTEGVILDFVKGSNRGGGGWRLVVRPPSDIRSLHKAEDFFYMHLFRGNVEDDGTVPKIQHSDVGYTEVKVVDFTKSVEVDGRRSLLPCKGIAFWKDSTLAKVLTKKDCHGGTYRTLSATSKVGAFQEIAPMGNSNKPGTPVEAHLHFGMNFGTGKSERDNPFYALKRSYDEPAAPFFSSKLLKDPSDSSKLFSKFGFWVDIVSENEYSLDKVDFKLIKSDDTNESLPRFSFGGRPGESRENVTDDQIKLIVSDSACGPTPTGSYSQPITQACAWDGTSPKKWRFFVPYDIASLPGGTHQLCTKMTSVNGYANTEDTCQSFKSSNNGLADGIYHVFYYTTQAGLLGLSVEGDFVSTCTLDPTIAMICSKDGQFIRTGLSETKLFPGSSTSCSAEFTFDGINIYDYVSHTRTTDGATSEWSQTVTKDTATYYWNGLLNSSVTISRVDYVYERPLPDDMAICGKYIPDLHCAFFSDSYDSYDSCLDSF